MAKKDESKAGTPLPVVEIAEAVEAGASAEPEAKAGVSFWFGELGIINFKGGGSFNATRRRETITDPELAAKLQAAQKDNPSWKIFTE